MTETERARLMIWLERTIRYVLRILAWGISGLIAFDLLDPPSSRFVAAIAFAALALATKAPPEAPPWKDHP